MNHILQLVFGVVAEVQEDVLLLLVFELYLHLVGIADAGEDVGQLVVVEGDHADRFLHRVVGDDCQK